MARLFFPHSFTAFRPFTADRVSAANIQRIPSQQKSHAVVHVIVNGTKALLTTGIRQPLILAGGLWLGLLAWSWPVAVAIAVGTTTAIALYLYQLRRLHVSWFNRFAQSDSVFSNQQRWQAKLYQMSDRFRPRIMQLWSQCWLQGNRPLTIALLSGGGLASIVATMALMYQDLHSKSLVVVMGLQLLTVVVIGAKVLKDMESDAVALVPTTSANESKNVTEAIAPSPQTTIHTIDQLWSDLTAKDTSVRLIAIYRSVNWVRTLSSASDPTLSTAMDATKLTACFRVMLSHETNPSVQKALRDGLMSLQDSAF